MGMFHNKRFVAGLGLAMAVVAITIAGASVAVASGAGDDDQVFSAETVKKAEGMLFDWAIAGATNDEFVISGEWELKCHGPCASAKLNKIEFDMAFVMVQSGGARSHSHQFSEFSATNVTQIGDNLTIDGIITGSGPIGTEPITLRLVNIAKGNATFFFKMNPGNAIHTEVGGVIIESK